MIEQKSGERYTFAGSVPDVPGALHLVAAIITAQQGNINRVQYDHRIDPHIVFFEVTAPSESFQVIKDALYAAGFLLTSLRPYSTLRCAVFLPHQSGALCEFLTITTAHKANIAFVDFDDQGKHPDRVTLALTLEDEATVDSLLQDLRSRYRIEVLECDTSGRALDDTVFYIRFAQEVRNITGNQDDALLLAFLGDINHIVQELAALGKDPREVFETIRRGGERLVQTSGDGFYADIQKIVVSPDVTLICCQPPTGGNVFLIDTPGDQVMIDTGYGIYHRDISSVLASVVPGGLTRLSRIIITHADADHCGAGAHYPARSLMHRGTLEIIKCSNRAFRSRSEDSVLEAVYTTMINLFSHFSPPTEIDLLPQPSGENRGPFPILTKIRIGGIEFEVLEGLGGHQYGQIYLFSPTEGLLFSGDTAINFAHITPDRADYNAIAVFLVTSVNVDSDLAREERKALLAIAESCDQNLALTGKRCIICGGHGPVSVLSHSGLIPYSEVQRFTMKGCSH
ncbi:MAG: MBL fold metallo-hydrolase [Methanomicrobiales archaeon]|nr:MBL fold metallo-hydrolase [Methanomicrobiales archaeon]